jgi:hypothetical protein
MGIDDEKDAMATEVRLDWVWIFWCAVSWDHRRRLGQGSGSLWYNISVCENDTALGLVLRVIMMGKNPHRGIYTYTYTGGVLLHMR